MVKSAKPLLLADPDVVRVVRRDGHEALARGTFFRKRRRAHSTETRRILMHELAVNVILVARREAKMSAGVRIALPSLQWHPLALGLAVGQLTVGQGQLDRSKVRYRRNDQHELGSLRNALAGLVGSAAAPGEALETHSDEEQVHRGELIPRLTP